MPMPRRVVRAGLAGLDRNQAVVIPGLSNKITAQASRFLPARGDAQRSSGGSKSSLVR